MSEPVPPEVRACTWIPERSGLEGGTRDARGHRWHHMPWQGWELDDHPPYLVPCVRWVPWWKRRWTRRNPRP